MHLPISDELCHIINNYLIIYKRFPHSTYSLLPPESSASQNYSLRPCVHSLQLPDHPNLLYAEVCQVDCGWLNKVLSCSPIPSLSHIADSNFIVRMLFRNVYLYRPKPIHCNYQLVHYSGFCRISPSILNRFKPNSHA